VGTDVLFARRMIERVAWILDDGCVAGRIGIRAQAEEYFARVMHVAIFVYSYDVFAEHHLAHTPEAVHHFESLIRILFPDADEDQIVKYAFRRQCHIYNFWEIHFEHWQENPHTSIADVVVLHRWDTDYCCRINRIMPVRDRCQVKNRIIFNRGVKASVITKWPLGAHLPGLNIAFQDKINV